MLKAPALLKANLSRWVSTTAIFSIGKWIPLLIAPIVVLYAYGQVQASQREVAENRVAQLTHDVMTLSSSLAQMEQFVASSQARAEGHAIKQQVLKNEKSDVLNIPAPASVIDILRIDQATDNN